MGIDNFNAIDRLILDGLDALFRIVLDAVDQAADGISLHQRGVVGAQQRAELVLVRPRIKPAIVILRQQHHRHAVVHAADQRVRFADDHRG